MMNIFCCLCEDRHLLLGIPSALAWTLEAVPCEDGSGLTLHIDGAKDVSLLEGKPINLSAQSIEVTDFAAACPDAIGPAECLRMVCLSDDITYLEIIKHSANTKPQYPEVTNSTEPQPKAHLARSAFYKWSKILSYLEDRIGVVTVSAWFDDVMVTEFTEEAVKIEVASDYKCEIINRRCLKLIQDALREVWGSTATVEVRVSDC